jgi:hypothetical protein
VVDNRAWAHIDAMWPKFIAKPHNVILVLAIDGVTPFSEKNNNWSSWLILLFNYNLSPWLAINFFCHFGTDYFELKICKNPQHRCLHGTFNKGTTSVVERGCSMGCGKGRWAKTI